MSGRSGASAGEFTPLVLDPDIDWFCTNAACALHVPLQRGRAWAETSAGLLFSRQTHPADSLGYCDRCVERSVRSPPIGKGAR